MKKLTALTLSAAIVPALVLGTAAFAEDRDDMHDDDMQAEAEHAGEQYMSGKPAGAFYADDVIGKTVKHRASDEDVGEIEDLVIGEDGSILGVVISTGGFLGLGGQDVGLGWDQLQHTMEDDEYVFYVYMDEETLRNAPEYERD